MQKKQTQSNLTYDPPGWTIEHFVELVGSQKRMRGPGGVIISVHSELNVQQNIREFENQHELRGKILIVKNYAYSLVLVNNKQKINTEKTTLNMLT